MMILLDSDAYTRLRRGDKTVVSAIRNADHVVMSAVVEGELLAGFRNGTRFKKNYDELLQFLANPRVRFAAVGPETAEYYGIIASSLRAKGRPIPMNDIWIAAHAFEMDAELLSTDRHYEAVDGISWHRLSAT